MVRLSISLTKQPWRTTLRLHFSKIIQSKYFILTEATVILTEDLLDLLRNLKLVHSKKWISYFLSQNGATEGAGWAELLSGHSRLSLGLVTGTHSKYRCGKLALVCEGTQVFFSLLSTVHEEVPRNASTSVLIMNENSLTWSSVKSKVLGEDLTCALLLGWRNQPWGSRSTSEPSPVRLLCRCCRSWPGGLHRPELQTGRNKQEGRLFSPLNEWDE